MLKKFVLSCALILFLCLWGTNASAQSASTAESAQLDIGQTLRQLVAEVHELRLVVQRATLTNTRFQMIIERLKEQQTEVDQLDRQLAIVRGGLDKLRNAKTDTEARIKELESKLTESSGEEHKAIEQAVTEAKRVLELRRTEEAQQVLSESDLTNRLQVEQSRLAEINNQLDLLLKELRSP